MWKYKNQIKIRWISFILGIILLLALFYFFKGNLQTQSGAKILLTRAQVAFESLPFWYYTVIVFLSISAMLVGVPSVCITLPLILLEGCTLAFVIGAACQMSASLMAMWISYKSQEVEATDILKNKLEANRDEFQSFAFWSRAFYNIPLRTIDRLTPLVHNAETGLYNSLVAASSAIMIRICIPTVFLKNVIEQFTLLEANPELIETKLLIWTVVLIIYTVIPKVPELMPCPKKVKKVIFELESPTHPSSGGKLMEEVTQGQEKTESEKQKD